MKSKEMSNFSEPPVASKRKTNNFERRYDN
jgi:hypothetical protein